MFFTPESVNPPPQISRDLRFLKSEHIDQHYQICLKLRTKFLFSSLKG
ncbi:LOW QUALITY PROTEIN: hypothetical protein TorRG33x02_140780 [Trema orientale]|uniref:Uncharacterized protein n=1 Tax=Trema orientale TaxID=63057 RepID=A0A2P5EWX9_TREOI|nr:LOW QUALITY PROTEIN: hypothetical protein TorRG33x02_140780 [Trema orientale]